MVQRTASRAKLPAETEAPAQDEKAFAADGAMALRVVPLKLGALVAPYRKHGRLSLRIERMPQQARLSAGRNNGNGSWSLGSDELDDLSYMLPESTGEHTLAIRVVATGHGAGNTLAVLDFLVASDAGSPAAPAPAPASAPAPGSDLLLQPLREELALLTATLAARDAELARRKTDMELDAAREAWKTELDARLAAAVAQSATDHQRNREAWDAEQTARITKLEERALERLLEAQERWQKDSREALAQAEQSWKAKEAARFAAAEAHWQEKSAKALAELARDRGADAALHGLQNELSTLKAKLAERETLLLEAQTAFQKAEQSWKAKEAARCAALETDWEQKSAKAVAEAHSEARQAERTLRDEIAKLTDRLTARDAALQEAEATSSHQSSANAELLALRRELKAVKETLAGRQVEIDALHAARQAELEETLLRAERDGNAKAVAQQAALERQWQTKMAEAVAAARAEAGQDRGAESALLGLREEVATLQSVLSARERELADARAMAEPKQNDNTALEALRGELASARMRLADRETDLTDARAAAERARIAWQREAQEALIRAEQGWKAKEGARIAAAEAQWRKQQGSDLNEAIARYEAAETALAHLRQESYAGQDRRAEAPIVPESEAEIEQPAEPAPPVSHTVLRTNRMWAAEDAAAAPEPRPDSMRRLIRDAAIAAALGASAIVTYPMIEPHIPPQWRVNVSLGRSAPVPPAATQADAGVSPAPAEPASPATAPVPAQPFFVASQDSNVRAGASASAAVVAELPRGAQVAVLDQRGSWLLVRLDGPPGKTDPGQGWVHRSRLKEMAGTPAKSE